MLQLHDICIFVAVCLIAYPTVILTNVNIYLLYAALIDLIPFISQSTSLEIGFSFEIYLFAS
jgi:hypothetical protein